MNAKKSLPAPLKLMIGIVVLIVVAMLSGCVTNPPKEPPTRNKFVEIPKELLIPCVAAKPVNRKQYLALEDYSDKEQLLVNAWLAQTTVVRKCSDTVRGLSDWNERQKKIYAEPAK